MRNDLIEALASTLEGISVTNDNASQTEATVLLFHPRDRSESGSLPTVVPLLELNLFEHSDHFSVILQSALGMIEMHQVDEIRLLDMTREAAFISRKEQHICVFTVSSHGVVQAYTNVKADLIEQDLADIAEEDLRAAVALKMFMENAQVFSLQSA